jgi:hypothetical protein
MFAPERKPPMGTMDGAVAQGEAMNCVWWRSNNRR